jgi:tRNA U34 5-methylaminomethyl-2-thiouridine-forming methyltransferase MnmC
MQRLEVQRTDDGSATLFVPALDEHYHSVKGAYTEALHIYRDCAYLHAAESTDERPLRLLEIGFGTGLNAVVTAMAATAERPVHYITLEKYPVDSSLIASLDYGSIVDAELLTAIHAAPWEASMAITPHFTLEKRCCDLLTAPLPHDIDIVYFDANGGVGEAIDPSRHWVPPS